MRRKNHEHEPELQSIAERLRSERPEASALELDQIKLSAMSRAKAAVGRANPRRLVVAALTVGLMAAGTGGVLAAGGSGAGAGNAASAQYSSTTACGNIGNGNGNNNGNGNGEGNGNENGNQNGNFNCNNNSFNNSGNTVVNNVTNNYGSSSTTTVTDTSTGSLGVAGSKVNKTSNRRLHIHVHVRGKLRRVSIAVNGRHIKTVTGRAASKNIVLSNLPCGSGATTVKITVTLSSGKTVTETHTYHLCT